MNKICIVCQSNAFAKYCQPSPRLFGRQYTIFACGQCGTGLTLPLPRISESHYEGEVRPEILTEDYSLEIRRGVIQYIDRFTAIRGEPPASLVDIGCGNGLILLEAKKLGLQVKGVEPSRGMCEAVIQRGVPVFNGYLEEFSELGNFDIILLSSVIEHLEDPIKALEILHANMSDKAVIVCQQAVYDGFLPKLIKKFWYGWSPSEHYWHFTEHAFVRMLNSVKFNVVFTDRSNLYYQFIPIKNLKYWKSFVFSNGCKLLSLVAAALRRGDSINFYSIKSSKNTK